MFDFLRFYSSLKCCRNPEVKQFLVFTNDFYQHKLLLVE